MFSRSNRLPLFYFFEFEQNLRNSAIGLYPEYPAGRQNEGSFFTFPCLNAEWSMRKIVKQVAGIDVAAKELVVSLGRRYDDWPPETYASKSFANNQKGFLSLVVWGKKLPGAFEAVRYVMEATGVYHEALAYFLDAKGQALTIVLPGKISHYFKTLDVKNRLAIQQPPKPLPGLDWKENPIAGTSPTPCSKSAGS